MRIIGGKWRGLTLASVGKGDSIAHLRPTSDRVRESLFSILMSHGLPGQETRVLDLFAGTGALGLEALSRGAASVTFVENGTKALALLDANIEKTGCTDRVSVLRRDARRLGAAPDTPFDLVFLDPPYGKRLGEAALSAVRDAGWIAPEAIIVWEEGAELRAPNGYRLLDHRQYGDTHLHILEPGA